MTQPTPDRNATRDANDGTDPHEESGLGAYDQSWAVIIGINDYQHYNKLQYAASDAVGVARMLIDRLRFPPGNVFLAVDSAAALPAPLASWLHAITPYLALFSSEPTKEVIEDLLLTRLPERTGADDRVVIYFAGHGKPRNPTSPTRKPKPYLVPANARPGSWHEHIELRDLLAKSEDVRAKHVLYVIDACSSGLAGMRSATQNDRFEQSLLRKKARQCLTAGTADEAAADRGYDGHSLFTWNLLQMLEGLRPDVADGILLASGLGAEIKLRVGKDGTSRQTPMFFDLADHSGGDFVFFAPEMPFLPQDSARLANLLIDEVGRRMEEPAPIAFARRLWERVLHAPPTAALQTDARRALARTALLLGETQVAVAQLNAESRCDDPEAVFMRGMAHLRLNSIEEAGVELARLAATHPDHRYAGWAARVARRAQGRRYALLIGVSEIDAMPKFRLPSAQHDVEAIHKLLSEHLGFHEVTVLSGRHATAANIENAFRQLAQRCCPEDSFVCCYAGTGFLRDEVAVYTTFDMVGADLGGLTEGDLDRFMRACPVRDKVLVTDGCHIAPLEEPAYRVLYACKRDEIALDLTTDDGIPRGAFTYFLEETLRKCGNVSTGALLRRISAGLATRNIRQTPGHTGSGASMFLGGTSGHELITLAELFHGQFSAEDLKRFHAWLRHDDNAGLSMSELWLALGRAVLAKHDEAAAIDALERSAHPRALLPLLRAELQSNRFVAASERWKNAGADGFAIPGAAELAGSFEPLLERLKSCSGHALLVATDLDEPDRTRLHHIKTALVERWGMPASRVKVRLNPSKAQLLGDVDALAVSAGAEPAFFLFVGPGNEHTELSLSTIDPEGRWGIVRVSELRERLARCVNLTAAIAITRTFVGWEQATSIRSADRARPIRGLGASTLVALPHMHRDLAVAGEVGPNIGALFDVLVEASPGTLSTGEWLARLGPSSRGVSVIGDLRAVVLSPPERRLALELLDRVEQLPLLELLALLERIVGDAVLASDAWLQLAIVRTALGHYERALADVNEALVRRRAASHESALISVWPEAFYWRGRILLGLRRYAEAEHDLAIAVQQAPDHARAHHCRARAIRQLIDADLERQLEASIDRYIELGAPFGIDDGLRQILKPGR